MSTEPNPHIVFAKFTDNDILDEMGRLLYSILNIFATNGYQVKLFDNINFSELDKYGQLAPSMSHLTLVDTIPDNSSHMLYLFDKEDKSCSHHQWKKKIQIKFDVFSIYRITDPVIMPYPVHPLLSGADLPLRLNKLRKNEKRLRIFFSGDTKGYTKNRIHYPSTKLPRLKVIETILEQLGGKTIHVKDETALKKLFNGDFINSCVIVDTSRLWIDPKDWLPNLSKADFFICPPGYVMPMCHNVIEAMAVGAIPVINYPEWFNPTLRHMENCIVFDDKKDLIRKIEDVLEMGQQKISEMRDKAINYYENHLSPRKFISDIESREENKITVLMITDKNTVKKASTLNEKSILISGKPTLINSRWYKYLNTFRT
ncbi:glycosyltransferase [Gammaproteobacteria bacterium]|nr:glycosyltransferase [Gammaproteobacteria bacterium]